MKRYCIVGNGVAGASAAEKIKATDPDGQITILSAETDAYYYRPRLPEFVAGEVELGRFTLRQADWYAKQGMDLRLGVTATSVDAQARTVATSDGKTVVYDELLLATGARAMIPPVPGSDLPGVFALRTTSDARAIREKAQGQKAAILVGGGLLGLEAGAALARMGLTVHVVEFFDRLLPRQMDAAGAAKLQGLLESRGFTFLLGARSKQITQTASGLALDLEDGRRAEGGLVLFSAGIRGNLDLAKPLGLEIKNGLVVDDRMRTSQANIWAAGDQVEHRGRLYGIWPASKAQGEVAGVNMAGGDAVYDGTVMSNSLKVAGVDLTAAGDIDPDGKLEAAVYQDGHTYRKIVLENGHIKGLIFFGITNGLKECQQAMAKNAPIAADAKALSQADFDFKTLIA